MIRLWRNAWNEIIPFLDYALTTFVLLSMALAILNANTAFALWSGRLLFAAARDRAMPDVLAKALSRVSTRLACPSSPPS